MPLCFGSCSLPQQFGGLHLQFGCLWTHIFKSVVFGKGISFKKKTYKLAKGKKFERNLNEWKYLASQNDSFTPGKVHRCEVINTSFVRLRFSRRFVLIRVGYLSSSEAYTNNWCFFGKKYYLAFDWWKHFFLNTSVHFPWRKRVILTS
jgi:hypothetical protein